MSFFFFQQRCDDCDKQWGASFGIVGTSQIGWSAKECPYCNGTDLASKEFDGIWRKQGRKS